MTNFKLHSKGENWFHFRKNLNSAMESFSITYSHDGTICMTGDYGCLSWQRDLFPKQLDYGFPRKDTDIEYFAEKVITAEQGQKIKSWKYELAKEEIKKDIETYKIEDSQEIADILEKVYDKIDFLEDDDYGYIQMLEKFNETSLEHCDYYHYGIKESGIYIQEVSVNQENYLDIKDN